MSSSDEEKTPHDYRIRFEKHELDLINRFNAKKVLEVFSGDGRNLIALAKMGYDVTGIESEDKYISKSKRDITKNKLDVKLIKHQVFMEKLPFKDEEFDFIYSYQFLNHNFKDQIEEVFKEIFRILKKGGLFSIKITDIEQFNLRHISGPFYMECDPEFPRIKYRKMAEQTFAKMEGDEKGIPHYGFYKDELKESLIKIGFKLIDIRKIRWNTVANCEK